jgi:hypothetical protein
MTMGQGPKQSKSRATKSELKRLDKRFRYADPKNIAKDFKSPCERAAIRAVLSWINLNATCAWRLKTGAYTDVAMSRGRVWRGDPHDAVIIRGDAMDSIDNLFKTFEE